MKVISFILILSGFPIILFEIYLFITRSCLRLVVIEVVCNKNEQILSMMLQNGILEALVEIYTHSTDYDTLVWLSLVIALLASKRL